MSVNTLFILLIAVLAAAGVLSVWKPAERRYVVLALLLVAGVMAWMVHAEHRARTAAVERARDDVEQQRRSLYEDMRTACRRASDQVMIAAARIEVDGDEFGTAGYLLFYGRPLFVLCGVEVDAVHAVGETDLVKQVAKLREAGEALDQRW